MNKDRYLKSPIMVGNFIFERINERKVVFINITTIINIVLPMILHINRRKDRKDNRYNIVSGNKFL